jgi:hypothetical protein
MAKPTNLIDPIREALAHMRSGDDRFQVLYDGTGSVSGRHQMLFFLKPEVLEESVDLERVLTMSLGLMETFEMDVEAANLLPAGYLGDHRVVSEHYGVIDAVAREPRLALSEQAREAFRKAYNRDPDGAPLIGGIEYLERHPDLDAEALAIRWLAGDNTKLGGGTYCQPLPDENLFLINGFYPRMLVHFTRPGNAVVSFVLRTDRSWKSARTEFIGTTDPAKAADGSLRRLLLTRREELRLEEISANKNGAHLSAGPVEGLVELIRFTSDLSGEHGRKAPQEFIFGGELLARYSSEAVQSLMQNPDLDTGEERMSVFDLTEELDSEQALEALDPMIAQLER